MPVLTARSNPKEVSQQLTKELLAACFTDMHQQTLVDIAVLLQLIEDTPTLIIVALDQLEVMALLVICSSVALEKRLDNVVKRIGEILPTLILIGQLCQGIVDKL